MRNRLLAMVALVVAPVAGCGDDGGGDVATATGGSRATDDPVVSETDVDTEGTGDDETEDGFSIDVVELDVELRVVNLLVDAGATEGSAIDVWSSYSTAAADARKLGTVEYGEVSEILEPVVSEAAAQFDPVAYQFTIYREGSTDDEEKLITLSQDAYPGQRLTVFVGAPEPQFGGVGAQTLFEDGGEGAPEHLDAVSDHVASDGGAVVITVAAGFQYLEDDAGNRLTFAIGPPTGGCLDNTSGTDGNGRRDLIGGTATLAYAVPPGATQLALYDGATDSSCAAAPAFGPFEVDIAAGESAYLVPYGATELLGILVIPA